MSSSSLKILCDQPGLDCPGFDGSSSGFGTALAAGAATGMMFGGKDGSGAPGPRSGGGKPVSSAIGEDKLLVKAAEKAGDNQRVQAEMDDLVQQFARETLTQEQILVRNGRFLPSGAKRRSSVLP